MPPRSSTQLPPSVDDTGHPRHCNAIVDLAGVLERHRKLVKATFTRKDEAALFEIANKFDLRHRDAGQRGDYDLDFFEWLFQW